MDYIIYLENIKKQYGFKEEKDEGIKLTHNRPQNIKLFPFDTKFNNKFNLLFEGDFEGIISDFSRIVIEKTQQETNEKEKTIEKMLAKIQSIPLEREIYLRDFFSEIFFHEESLLFVHPKLVFRLKESKTKEIAFYLVDVLLDDDNKKKIKKLYEDKNKEEDIFTKILLSSLEELKDKKVKSSYLGKLNTLKKVFNEDLSFLLENSDVFVDEFERTLLYYYFIYTSQLALKMNKFFDVNYEEMEEVYFNLSWEKTSHTRLGFRKGWKTLEKQAENLFSHVHSLEILNNSNYSIEKNEVFTFDDLLDKMLKNPETSKKNLIEILLWYRTSVSDINWQDCNFEELSLKELLMELFNNIDFQFRNSTRKKPYTDFTKWYTEFAKGYFLKRRGTLGYMLNLNQDYIFLLTKLVIKHKEKIRLLDLFSEFEIRGVYLDKDSRESLKEMYEKLNLLDKKSDSGDAIYVKSIL